MCDKTVYQYKTQTIPAITLLAINQLEHKVSLCIKCVLKCVIKMKLRERNQKLRERKIRTLQSIKLQTQRLQP